MKMSFGIINKKTITLKNGEKIDIRQMIPDDLENVEKLSVSVYFDVGMHNMRLFYRMSPKQWQVAVNENGEIVSLTGYNEVEWKEVKALFGYTILTRVDYRNQGITSHFSRPWETGGFIASSTQYSLQQYAHNLYKFYDKRGGFFMPMSADLMARIPRHDNALGKNIQLHLVCAGDQALFDQMCEYDKKVYLMDRSEFLFNWGIKAASIDEGANIAKLTSTIIAIDEYNRPVGYGTIRYYTSRYFGIQPLYADSDAIAMAILVKLALTLTVGENVYFPVNVNKRCLLQFAHDLNLYHENHEVRNCNRAAQPYMDAIMQQSQQYLYCTHEFYPI